MSSYRLFTHPLLLNRRSRTIFFWCLLSVGLVFFVLWRDFFKVVASANINLSALPSDQNILLSILLSPITQIAIALFGTAIGGALIAVQVVGPLKRIEEWLLDLEHGRKVKPIEVRFGDRVYGNIIRMMNVIQAETLPKRRKKN